MSNFNRLMDSAVDVRIMIQEVDKDGEVRYDNIFLLSENTPEEVMKEIVSEYADLHDLINNEDNKEEYKKRLNGTVQV